MRLLITGATGFVGKRLVQLAKKNQHEVVVLTRNPHKAKTKLGKGVEAFQWYPENELPPYEALEGVDGIIHLLGENIAAKRWSSAQKQRILNSRVKSTENLVKAVEKYCSKPLKVFVGASAIGFYSESDHGDPLNENSPAGQGFLPNVCHSWEKASEGILAERRVIIRIGVVLGPEDGALGKILPIFKLGLGGPIGSGEHSMSWIHADDLGRLLLSASENTQYEGVYNGVAPQAVTNYKFTKSIGHALKRPTVFPVPPIALKLALGEMSDIVLQSQHVVSKRLEDEGFQFKYPDIDQALNHLLTQSKS